jgi:putative glutamine amidotransferase
LKIGLTRTESGAKHKNYLNWLGRTQGEEVITLSFKEKNVDQLKGCDALVLSGGIDIDPRFYGSSVLDYPGAPKKFNPLRDDFEISALQLALRENLPILGICRGLQLINVVCKGTLVQDLGQGQEGVNHEGSPDKLHLVFLEPKTLLGDLAATSEGKVNTSHHQAIDTLGEGLLVNCRAPDHSIEGIEWEDKKNKPFMIAVQWHPERMSSFHLEGSPLCAKLRQGFFEAIKKRKK